MPQLSIYLKILRGPFITYYSLSILTLERQFYRSANTF